MNEPTPKDYSLGSFDEVIVEKTKLLEKLRANRADHNGLYDAAVSGYWIEAAKVLDKRAVEFKEALGKSEKGFTERFTEMQVAVAAQKLDSVGHFHGFFSFNASWPLTFPKNQLADYDRVISLLEFSVADKVELSVTEFDCYVRNNWSWNEQFVTTNRGYVSNYVTSNAGQWLAVSGGCISPTFSRAQAFVTGGASILLNS